MILGPYGGPGGWAEGLRSLGLSEVGVEIDPSACATRAAAGHATIRADVATFPVDHLAGKVEGATLSPPCQQFSSAGKGEGRKVLDRLVGAVHRGDWHAVDPTRSAGYGHVLEVGRWVETIRPRWVACEQVPEVLPVWQACAHRWRSLGYSTWAGVLCAADFGVGQTRRRAILMASRDRRARPPEPTHAEHPTMFGLAPWVTMVQAVGWPEGAVLHHIRGAGMAERHGDRPGRRTDQPAFTIEGGSWRRMVLLVPARHRWMLERPATTVVGDGRVFGPHSGSAGESQSTNAVKVTLPELLVLQGFPPDYPVQGTKTSRHEQVGNAIPPPLAAAVVAALTGRQVVEEAA